MSSNVEALELFVELLSADTAEASRPGEFHSRLCDGICRLAHMRRAVIFTYDSARRRVRAVGTHGMPLETFAGANVSVESAPFAALALAEDRVVEVAGDISGQVPAEFAALVDEPSRLVCAPMAAAGLAVGVILADRPLGDAPIDDGERHLLWTLGKAAALATVARVVATRGEQARSLEARIDLARDIHERVVQRLFGVSLALDGDGDLPEDARRRCATETQAALGELRQAIQRPLGRTPRATRTTLREEVDRLANVHRDLGVRLESDDATVIPDDLEPLAQSVLAEAVRNAHKHASPSHVSVRLATAADTFVLEVTNDGVDGSPRQAGMGLRLAALEALQSGGVVEFGEREPGTWQVRLVVPCGPGRGG